MEINKNQPCHVYVIDDDEHVCQFMANSLKSVGYLVTSCYSSRAFLELEHHANPSCLLLDLVLPGESGIELYREILNRKLVCSVVFISGYANVANSVEAMKLGAVDFLQKPCSSQLLLKTVDLALREALVLNQMYQEENLVAQSLESLTSREHEILGDIANGLLTKEVAKKRGISHRTVEVHRSHIMNKLNLESPTQLAHLFSVMERQQLRIDQYNRFLRKNHFSVNDCNHYPQDDMAVVQ